MVHNLNLGKLLSSSQTFSGENNLKSVLFSHINFCMGGWLLFMHTRSVGEELYKHQKCVHRKQLQDMFVKAKTHTRGRGQLSVEILFRDNYTVGIHDDTTIYCA